MGYPKWIYHKTEPAKIVANEDEHKACGKGWEETPAAFADVIDADEEKPAKKSAIKDQNLVAMKNAELVEILVEAGVDASELKGLKKDDLIARIGEL